MANQNINLDPPQGGCEVEQPEGWYCSRDFHHNGPCATHRLPLSLLAANKPLDGMGTMAGMMLGATPVHVGEAKEENSGLNVDYYRVHITNPNQADAPYMAECSDIIEATGMDFNEGEAFKAIWRNAAARTLGKKKAGDDAIRNAQKVMHFGRRMVAVLIGKKIEAKATSEVTNEVQIRTRVLQRVRNIDSLIKQIREKPGGATMKDAAWLLDAIGNELEQLKRNK